MTAVTFPGLGTYGLRIGGLDGARRWMQHQPPSAPALQVRVALGAGDDRPSRYDRESADLRLLDGGRLRVRRGDGQAAYLLPEIPPDGDLLHPYLAPAAALIWRWDGREALHGGVFAGASGAVLLLGDKEAGKSTTLAWLATAGVPVLADDLAILHGKDVLAGPRSVDLRADAPVGPVTDRVRRGDRRRLVLPPVPDRLPLVGVAVLEWGAVVDVAAVPAADRPAQLKVQRCYPALDTDPVSLLEVLALPMLRFTRPRHHDQLPAVGQALIGAFGALTPATPRGAG